MTRTEQGRQYRGAFVALSALALLLGCSPAIVPHVVVDTTAAKAKTAHLRFRMDTKPVERSWFVQRKLYVDISTIESSGQRRWLCTLGESPPDWGYRESETVAVEPGAHKLYAEAIVGTPDILSLSLVGVLTGNVTTPHSFKSVASGEQTVDVADGMVKEVVVLLSGHPTDESGSIALRLEQQTSSAVGAPHVTSAFTPPR
jgi:hypothetical protein